MRFNFAGRDVIIESVRSSSFFKECGYVFISIVPWWGQVILGATITKLFPNFFIFQAYWGNCLLLLLRFHQLAQCHWLFLERDPKQGLKAHHWSFVSVE